jgi:transcriptional regulator with XRE-family HTH domain
VENESVPKRFGANLRAVRLMRELKQSDVVERLSLLGVPLKLNLVSKMENGTRIPDIRELLALAIALGVTPNRLLVSATASNDAEIELTPEVSSVEATAWQWASGNDPLYKGDLPDGIPDVDLWEFREVNRPHQPPNRTLMEEVSRYQAQLESIRTVTSLPHVAEVPKRVTAAYLQNLAVVFQALAEDEGEHDDGR